MVQPVCATTLERLPVRAMGRGTTKKPLVARIWRGRVRRERAAEYQKYNYEVGIKPLIAIAVGVQAFREDRETETEFVTISCRESVEAMSRFTGATQRRSIICREMKSS
jgi:hypothetical protein